MLVALGFQITIILSNIRSLVYVGWLTLVIHKFYKQGIVGFGIGLAAMVSSKFQAFWM